MGESLPFSCTPHWWVHQPLVFSSKLRVPQLTLIKLLGTLNKTQMSKSGGKDSKGGVRTSRGGREVGEGKRRGTRVHSVHEWHRRQTKFPKMREQWGTGEMVQGLRALVVLPEFLGSISSNYVVSPTISSEGAMEVWLLMPQNIGFGTPQSCSMCTSTQ